MFQLRRTWAGPTELLWGRSYYAHVGHTRLHYRMAGDGPPLVLIHGYGASASWWRSNIPALAAYHRVYALDLAGFGRSWPKRTFSLERAVEDVMSWMHEIGMERADFCGHSMGGHLCIRLAATQPECVRKLVLVAASGLPLNTRLLALAWNGLRSGGHTRFRFAPIALQTALQAGPLVLWSALRDLLASDVREELARIAAPTLIIWGEQDVMVPLDIGRVLHMGIAQSHLAVVPDTGHNVMYERPETFNRLVLDFLSD